MRKTENRRFVFGICNSQSSLNKTPANLH